MNLKKIKIAYVLVVIFGVFLFVFLIISPRKAVVQTLQYQTDFKPEIKTYQSEVRQNIKTEDDSFRLQFFLRNDIEYDNLEISLLDGEKELLKQHIEHYNTFTMIFDGLDLKKGKNYTLIIKDLDNEDIDLITAKRSGDSYIIGRKDYTLKLVTYSFKNNYFNLWYPIFIFALAFTIYPFVWSKK